ncbi:hypothetical protein CAPTEDRAFT_228685 [Capitella teleta]|uniref:SAP domain-containing protein n=1 Tax=Capitella teleta TaxID=283909 RepID=R7U830_CAPTE|nr:hypothetical protein CAPTEDRAFT_228685 [Capitella teleta]|eukprot:ELT99801.1 hypothetical protein CAPTEDRAFT_228685 [Capitella teleta]
MADGYGKMTVGQLKEELVRRELDTSGKKADLVARLTEADEVATEEPAVEATEEDAGGEVAQVEEGMEEGGSSEQPAEEEPGEEEAAMEEEEATEGTSTAEETAEESKEREDGENGDQAEEAVETQAGDEQEFDDDLSYEGVNEAKKQEGDGTEGDDGEEKTEADNGEPKEYEDLDSDPNFIFIKWADNKNICIPMRDQIRTEVLAETEERSVAVFPIVIEDLTLPSVTGLLQQCLHFNICFRSSVSQTDKSEQGCLELMFRTSEEAQQVCESTQDMREGCEIKHLGCPESKKLYHEWQKDNQKAAEAGTSDSILNRLLFVGNLPPNTEETQLHEMFADGNRAIMARTEDKEQRGYGYVLFETEAQVDEAVKANKETELEGRKLCVMKCVKEKPMGMLSDAQREGIVKKIRAVRNTLKYRGNMMSFEDQHYQKTLQSRLLAKLRGDTNVRREHGLLPPDRIKMLEERDAKYKAQQRDKPEGAKPMGRGRGRGGPGFSPRGFRGGRGGGFPRGGGGGGGGGGQWGAPGPRGGWGGPRGGGRGNMAMAMDLLQNISHALGGRGGGRGGRGAAAAAGGHSGQQQGGGGFRHGQESSGHWGGQGGYGQQGQQQGNWNKRRASNEGGYNDWKRPRTDGWGGGYSRGGGRGGGGSGGQRQQQQHNWY